MTSISSNNAAEMFQLPKQMPMQLAMRGNGLDEAAAIAARQGKGSDQELREKFTQFVGEAFFGQMFKSMRATVGKPAYFHGGRAEEAFQGQLDQTLSQHMTEASAARFADPMFERQFPQYAEQRRPGDLSELSQLQRR